MGDSPEWIENVKNLTDNLFTIGIIGGTRGRVADV